MYNPLTYAECSQKLVQGGEYIAVSTSSNECMMQTCIISYVLKTGPIAELMADHRFITYDSDLNQFFCPIMDKLDAAHPLDAIAFATNDEEREWARQRKPVPEYAVQRYEEMKEKSMAAAAAQDPTADGRYAAAFGLARLKVSPELHEQVDDQIDQQQVHCNMVDGPVLVVGTLRRLHYA